MKNISVLNIIIPLLVMAFVFTNCDVQDSTVGTFGDVADKVPNYSVVEGAENDKNSTKLDGNYPGWCAHWSAPTSVRLK